MLRKNGQFEGELILKPRRADTLITSCTNPVYGLLFVKIFKTNSSKTVGVILQQKITRI